ncbi:type IV pilus biogenesis protein PilM [Pseudomonas oryzae]|uniref:MSHA biogenesis protein MshI n=1 Tax=Pseudomonas oryzae TaxID=1392877 RepID=A0A1H1WKF6_9PSED|nr:MSHA biogenesis protein MshI [Pseudomonas oryzae]SDS97091.1 MSHA biogenesis protein MshI [Pseudomonas oryzae]
MLAWLKRTTGVADTLLGLAPVPGGCVLARVQRGAAGTRLLASEFVAAAPASDLEVLRRRVDELGLADQPVNLLLAASDYQLLLVERPDVAAAELGAAIRWRIRDLVNAPLDTLVVDAFPLPTDAYRGRTAMAYCAVLPRARMQALADWVEGAGLRLSSIDIPEMALRNLGLLAGAEGQNLAVLQVGARNGLICVQNGSDLYMVRRIEHGQDNRGENSALLALEVQRSLDYFESHLGKGAVSRLCLLPLAEQEELLLAELRQRLSLRIERLALDELFAGAPLLELPTNQQAQYLPAIGAALRQERGR